MFRYLSGMIMVLMLATPSIAAEKLGVYIKAIEKAEGPFQETVNSLETGLSEAGFEVMASYESGVDERCAKRAHVVVFNDKAYSEKIMSHGPLSAFALPLRAALYETPEGINVAFVNPASINRTVLGDDVETGLSSSTASAINTAITSGVKGKASGVHIGQIRDKGYVGGMGGGKFIKKIATFHEGGTASDTVAAAKIAADSNDKNWTTVYSVEPSEGVFLMGLTKSATEAKAFDIAGDKRESKKDPCPGLDHAAAFPIEVVVYEEKGEAKMVSLDEMYRMKVYFEDAGKWAFMKNMSMPGNIEDELEDVITSGLKNK